MKNTLLMALLFITISCNQNNAVNEEKIKTEVGKAWKGLYNDYENANISFTDYYQEDVIRMGTDGGYEVGKEIFKKGWVDHYKDNEVQLLAYSQPTILPSRDQAVTFNTYDEIFINKQTQDTTFVKGTWVAIWKRQQNGSWKICMSTWHNE